MNLGLQTFPGSSADPPRRMRPSRVITLGAMAELTIPADLKPRDGRFGCGPSKVRPEQLQALCRRGRPVRHLAPPAAGQEPGGPGPRRAASAVFAARRLRGDPWQRRLDGILGCGGVRADRQALAAPDLRRVQLASSPPCVAKNPFVGDPIIVRAEPGSAPKPQADPSVDLIGWAHNETSTGVAVPVVRPAGSGDA